MLHLGFEIGRLNRIMVKRRISKNGSAHHAVDQMTNMHGYLLRYLYENRENDIFQKDIEMQFSISRSSVTTTLQTMEKNGLILRESVEQDARLKRIRLTSLGTELHLQIEQEIQEFEEMLTKGISEEEQKSFLQTLQKMRKNLEEEIV